MARAGDGTGAGGRWRRVACALVVAVLALPTGAQQPDSSDPDAVQQAAFEAMARGAYEEAEQWLRRQIELEPGSFVPYYNLACALARQGRDDAALAMLLEAVRRGFVDLAQLQRDPDLASLRDHEGFRELTANWSRVLDAHRDANLEAARRQFSRGRYTQVLDESRRLAYWTAFDPWSFGAAREEVERLYGWATAELFPELRAPEALASEPWVVVVLPTRRDFSRWSLANFGTAPELGTLGAGQVGGQYSHDARRLVSMDLGSSLRHELLHVLHWRSATRLGQLHPIWIQEGLCSLVEDYDVVEGRVVPVPSWRTNVVRQLAEHGRLLGIDELAALPREQFTGVRPLAHYAQARAVFLYLYQTGRLGTWYRQYVETYRQDPSGLTAIEAVTGRSIEQVNAEFRAWAQLLPEVMEYRPDRPPKPGTPMLGFVPEPGDGDGPVVAALGRGTSAAASGLRRGDVITAINGRPTRDINELMRVLGSYLPGDVVEVAYRRGAVHGTVQVQLSAR